MNTGLTINTAANTIEMTKEFARKAKYFGTDEYKLLQDARKDYPTFSVATRKTVSKESYKGLTINYMYNYIKKHPQTLTLEDGNEVKALEVFTEIAGLDENGKKMTNVETAFYGEIRAWFLLYSIQGRGSKATFKIEKIPSPFQEFCMDVLKFDKNKQ